MIDRSFERVVSSFYRSFMPPFVISRENSGTGGGCGAKYTGVRIISQYVCNARVEIFPNPSHDGTFIFALRQTVSIYFLLPCFERFPRVTFQRESSNIHTQRFVNEISGSLSPSTSIPRIPACSRVFFFIISPD